MGGGNSRAISCCDDACFREVGRVQIMKYDMLNVGSSRRDGDGDAKNYDRREG